MLKRLGLLMLLALVVSILILPVRRAPYTMVKEAMAVTPTPMATATPVQTATATATPVQTATATATAAPTAGSRPVPKYSFGMPIRHGPFFCFNPA